MTIFFLLYLLSYFTSRRAPEDLFLSADQQTEHIAAGGTHIAVPRFVFQYGLVYKHAMIPYLAEKG